MLDLKIEACLEYPTMKTSDALLEFNNSVSCLASALGITREAIYQWGENVPLLRIYQIRELLARRVEEVSVAEPPPATATEEQEAA